MPQPRILILTLTNCHGAAHQRMANAMRRALLETQPDATVEVVDGLEHCAAWFHLYYNSYLIPMRYWPSLWRRIENLQHRSAATSPGWLYRQGGQRLFRFIKAFDPDIVVATEVGLCELAAMLKREAGARFRLVGLIPGVDADRPWAQPEVDLYPVAPGKVVEVLEAAGVPRAKILPCGMPIDPLFSSLPERSAVRARLTVQPDIREDQVGELLPRGSPFHRSQQGQRAVRPSQICHALPEIGGDPDLDRRVRLAPNEVEN